MRIGTVSMPNQKGQVVIPKQYRDQLGIVEDVYVSITLQGNGVFIQPILGVVNKTSDTKIHLDVLKKTQGAWHDTNWEKTRKKRRVIELQASKRRKLAW